MTRKELTDHYLRADPSASSNGPLHAGARTQV
jgi:hypothetical protein